MKLITKVFLVLVVSFFVNVSNASECTSSVRYINGVWNRSPINANLVTDRLRESLLSKPGICVEDPLFNSSRSYISDISETYALKSVVETGRWTTFKNKLLAGITSAVGNIVSLFTKGELSSLDDYKSTLDSMYSTVKSDLDAGKGVILVSHSEGNLFALALKNKAKIDGYPDWKVEIMHLAPPTVVEKETDRNYYITSDRDDVIGILLNKNKANFTPLRDSSLGGHGMLSTYLNPDMRGEYFNFKCSTEKNLNTQAVVVGAIEVVSSMQYARINGLPYVYIGFSFCRGLGL